MVWWWLLMRKLLSWALSLTVSSVVSSSSHLGLVSLSVTEILWPSGLLCYWVCFLILSHIDPLRVVILCVCLLYF